MASEKVWLSLLKKQQAPQEYMPGMNVEPDGVPPIAYDPQGPSKMPSADEVLRMAETEALLAQRGGIEQLEKQKGRIAGMQAAPDYSGLIGLTDWLSGGKAKAAQAYEKPTSQEDIEAMKFKLENEIQKGRGGLAKSIADALRQQKNDKAFEAQMRQDRFETKHLQGLEKDLSKDLDKNYLTPARDKSQMFNQMEDQLSQGKVQDVYQSLSNFARNIGGEKGAMSEGDVGRQLARTLDADLGKLKQYFTGDAKADASQISQLKKTLEIAKATTAKAYSDSLNSKKSLYSSQTSYKPLFVPGMFGETGFQIAEQAVQSLAPKPMEPEVREYQGKKYKRIKPGPGKDAWEEVK